MIDDNEMKLIRHKLTYFFNNKIKVHIETRTDRFYNGFVKSIDTDFIMFDDRMIGELPIFFLEISRVEEFKVEGVK